MGAVRQTFGSSATVDLWLSVQAWMKPYWGYFVFLPYVRGVQKCRPIPLLPLPVFQPIPPQLRRELGLPHHPREGEANEEATWQKLMDEADRSVLEEYPMLAAPPLRQGPRPDPSVTPVRLYHAMAALDDPSIVFTGRPKFVHNFRLAETQAIWATAYFDGHITLPKREELQKRVAYMNALSRRRYLSKGADGVNLMPEFIWYTDYLLQQAGLSSHRKSWFEDPDEPAFNSDLRDCRDEYLAKYRAVNGSEVA